MDDSITTISYDPDNPSTRISVANGAAEFLGDSPYMLVHGYEEGVLQLIDTDSQETVKGWQAPKISTRWQRDYPISQMAVSADGRTAAIFDEDAGEIWIWTPFR